MRRARKFLAMSSAVLRKVVIGLGCVLLLSGGAQAGPITITNGAFETGTLAGWTLFTTVNGTTGPPTVVSFDTTGTGATYAARFLVGQLTFVPGDQQGGGIYQDFVTTAGPLSLYADIAAQNQTIFPNAAGGLFSMLLDDVTIASFDFGFIAVGAIERSSLSYVGSVSAGTHELRFLVTRPFLAGPPPGGTPYQYIDNIRAEVVPEPATLTLFGTGLASLAARKLRRRFRLPRERA
jgi:hypothetical protein